MGGGAIRAADPGFFVTRTELADALTAYAAGLDAEIGLLRQIEALASGQRVVSGRDDLTALTGMSEHRNRLMSGLAELELRLHPIRALIVEHLAIARALPAFEAAAERHRLAASLIGRIMATDRTLMTLLEEALETRRRLAHSLEEGGLTLAAYRRVLAPSISSAGLVDRRG